MKSLVPSELSPAESITTPAMQPRFQTPLPSNGLYSGEIDGFNRLVLHAYVLSLRSEGVV